MLSNEISMRIQKLHFRLLSSFKIDLFQKRKYFKPF